MATYLTTAETAARLGLDLESVQALCRRGNLPGAIKDPKSGNWMIPIEAITAWLSKATAQHPPSESSGQMAGSGDTIQVGNVSESHVAIGRGSQVIVSSGLDGEALAHLFVSIYDRIAARAEDPDVDKGEIAATVEKIEAEAAKGEAANPTKLQRWLKFLAEIAPDVLDVVLAALLSPTGAIATAVRKVAERAKANLAK